MRSRNTSQCLTAPISYLHRLRYLTIRRKGINFGFYLQSFSAEIWDAPPLQFFPVQVSSPRCMIQKLLICEYRGHSYLQSTLNCSEWKEETLLYYLMHFLLLFLVVQSDATISDLGKTAKGQHHWPRGTRKQKWNGPFNVLSLVTEINQSADSDWRDKAGNNGETATNSAHLQAYACRGSNMYRGYLLSGFRTSQNYIPGILLLAPDSLISVPSLLATPDILRPAGRYIFRSILDGGPSISLREPSLGWNSQDMEGKHKWGQFENQKYNLE